MIKKEKGIALVSLIITIAVMTVIASTVVYMSMDRFEINNLRKMYTDIELLQDKVSNYYLKYNALPILRNAANEEITYNQTLDFTKNSVDNEVYYILDLEAMEGISLNYGKEGFKNPNSSNDVYIINEQSHQIYYVKGMTLKETTYYTIAYNGSNEDNIPPSSPRIRVLSGNKNSNGTYINYSAVELELIPGKEEGNVAKKTEFSTDNGSTWNNINELDNNIYPITTTGQYSVKIRSYDKNDNISENNMDLLVEIRERKPITVASTNQSWLTLPRSYESRVSNYKIYGNSIQEGIPTPEAPIEIQSVGEESKNQLENKSISRTINGVTFTNNEDGSITMNGTNTGTSNIVYIISDAIIDYARTMYLKADTYTISHGATLPKGIYLQANYVENGTSLYKTSPSTFTITEDVQSVVYIRFDVGVTANNITIYPQLEKGTEATEYEQYGKYNIPVKVSGKNLLDNKSISRTINGVTFTNNEDGSITMNGTNTGTKDINYVISDAIIDYARTMYLKADTYTISHGATLPKGIYLLANYAENGTSLYKQSPSTFTTTEDVQSVVYIRFDVGVTANNITIYPQLEKGTTATEYEPYVEPQTFNIYLDEPLRKVGEYADYIDFTNQKVIRKIYSEKFNLENATIYKTGDNWQRSNCTSVYVSDKLSNIGTHADVLNKQLSNMLKSGYWEWSRASEPFNYVLAGHNNKCLYLIIQNEYLTGITNESSDAEKINAVKNYFSNDNLEVAYVLKEEISQRIELPELVTFNGYTNIEVLTEIEPSKIEATYEGYEIK